MKARIPIVIVIFTMILVVLLSGIASGQSQATSLSNNIVIINFNGNVDPGASAFFKSSLGALTPDNTKAVVIDMNTPGGYITSMLQIISYINHTEQQEGIPVYTYVPSGGLASSAGSYIALASDYIYMGKNSLIGPSQPVVLGGSSSETANMVNLMTSLAVAHGKNVTASLSMIYNGSTFTDAQALSAGLINGQASNLTAFLQLEGLASSSSASNVTVQNPNLYDSFLSFLSDSFVDGILIALGAIAILLDLYHGSVLLTVIGLVMIGLGLVGAEIIGAPLIGLLLILGGAILIMFEIKTGHGFMMISGIIVSVIGAFLLAPSYISYAPSASSSSPFSASNLYLAAAIIIVVFFLAYYLQYIIRSLGKKKFTGVDGMVGHEVTVKQDLTPEGWVSFEGVKWKARLVSGDKATVGEKLVIRSSEGLTLLVEKQVHEEKKQ